MIHEAAFPEGTPAWVDLVVADRRAAMDFYGALFGWDFDEGAPETGFYTTALRRGQRVAGIGEPLPGAEAPPPMWTTYLAVDDADAVATRARAAGATVLVEPMAVRELGRTALLVDPTGAVVGLWEAGAHTGANLVDEPGTLTWAEALSHDVAAAREFYRTVLGYGFVDRSGPGFEYAAATVGGEPVAGFAGPGALPAGYPPHWRVHFAVADTDTVAARAVQLGAAVLDGPRDSGLGRLTVLSGPAGEEFTVLAPEEPARTHAGAVAP